MRILILDRFFGGRDGPGIYIHDLAAGLLARGHRVALAHGKRQGDYAPPGLEPIEIPGLERHAGSLGGRRALAAALANFRPDVAVAQCLDVLWFADRVRRVCPLVAAFHTHAISCPNWVRYHEHTQRLCDLDFGPACAWHTVADGCGNPRPQAIALNMLRTAAARRMMRHVDAVQAVTPYMRRMIENTGLFAPDQIFDLVYPAPFFDEGRAYRRPSGAKILYVGRLHHTKGPQCLIQACARLGRPFELLLVGGGPDEQALREQARRLGVEGQVRLLAGREDVVTRADLSRLYDEAQVVAVPSIWGDPSPLVRLEAMAHGRPLVGFDSGGVADCIEDGVNGFVIPRLAEARLADAIRRLLDDGDLAERMGRASLARAHEHHHPARQAQRLEETFERLISARRR